jgi:hypothetical protein
MTNYFQIQPESQLIQRYFLVAGPLLRCFTRTYVAII